MIENGLNTAISELTLGNGSVYNFIDYIGRMHITGGIVRYSLRKGYFLNNIANNFSGGKEGRYGYGNGNYAGAKEKLEGTDGVLLADNGELIPASLKQDKVGDFYSTNYRPQNSDYKFYTLEEFSALGDAIRRRNIQYNVKENDFKNRYSTVDEDNKFLGKNLPAYEIGDDVVSTESDAIYSTLFGKRRTLRDTSNLFKQNNLTESDIILDLMGRLTADYYNTYTSRTPQTPVHTTNDGENYYGVNLRRPQIAGTLQGYGRKSRDFVKTLQKQNEVIVSSPLSKPSRRMHQEAVFGEFYDKEDDRDLIYSRLSTIKNNGLDYYYKSEREKYSTKSRNPFWWAERSYGVTTHAESYSYEDGVKAALDQKIDPRFTESSMRRNVTQRNAGTYTYYQEVDGTSPVTGIDKSTTMDGFTPQIGEVSRGSMLMKRVNSMFRDNKVKSLINRFHTNFVPDPDDELSTSYTTNFGVSRGRNLLRAEYENSVVGDRETGFDNPYCRVWTAHHQYSTMKDRIRPFMDGDRFMSIKDLQANYHNMRPNGTILSDYTTLQDSGYVKIAPTNKDGVLEGGNDGLKKYMFSIENLAWKGFRTDDRLSPEQQGPNGGRIMWFPPYNLKFTENVSTSWKENEFIGRGEKIYTYANTDRSGTLTFTLLIDHPSIVNKWRGMGDPANKEKKEKDLLRFFAGCGPLEIDDTEDTIIPTQRGTNDEDNKDNTTPKPKPKEQFIKKQFIIFYPNNFSAKKYNSNAAEMVEKLDAYERGGNEAFTEMDTSYERQVLKPNNYDNESKYNLNRRSGVMNNFDRISELIPVEKDVMSYDELKDLAKYMNDGGEGKVFGMDPREYAIDTIEVCGYASDHGYPALNSILSSDRAETIKKLALHFCGSLEEAKFRTGDCHEVKITKVGVPEDVNLLDAKIARSATITFNLKLREDVVPVNEAGEDGMVSSVTSPMTENGEKIPSTSGSGVTEATGETKMATIHNPISPEGYYTYQNEYMYFKTIEAEDKLVYKNIIDKIKFFEPAFHSLTPEGFNARLNFLHQCTRQGPTIGTHAGGDIDVKSDSVDKYKKMAANLAFGMAPYCILRIGDFFYSKICIDSMSIDYDNGGGVQWDLNPEGIGVQPTMATVNLNFRFLGGQNLDGPVEELQNAISYNYYANTSVYTAKWEKTADDNDTNTE